MYAASNDKTVTLWSVTGGTATRAKAHPASTRVCVDVGRCSAARRQRSMWCTWTTRRRCIQATCAAWWCWVAVLTASSACGTSMRQAWMCMCCVQQHIHSIGPADAPVVHDHHISSINCMISTTFDVFLPADPAPSDAASGVTSEPTPTHFVATRAFIVTGDASGAVRCAVIT